MNAHGVGGASHSSDRTRRSARRAAWLLGFCLLGVVVLHWAVLRSTLALRSATALRPPATATAPGLASPTTALAPCTAPGAVLARGPGAHYGPWVLAPALVTIVLAIVLRQVVIALGCGVLFAATMLVPFPPADTAFGIGPFAGLQLAVEHYLIGALADSGHLKVIIFSLLIGAMVGVIAANGGTGAVVNAVARWGTSPRKGQLAGWFAGLLVFFDDYANAMIIGPALRPVYDRLRISRAKLAYIVDSTAAPVASLALIGTWIGAEVGYLQDGLDLLPARPVFLEGQRGYQLFLSSLPYRFYVILALIMVLLVALLRRDFGPMLRAERAAAAGAGPVATHGEVRATRGWYAVTPVLVLVAVTLLLLVLPGWRNTDWESFQPQGDLHYGLAVLQEILRQADPYNPILYAALAALVLAGAVSVTTGALNVREVADSGLESMSRLLPTLVILTLAWTLSGTMKDLQLGEVAVNLLRAAGFEQPLAVRSLPMCIFVAAAVVSFTTGTSWGTMGILCPAVVGIAAGLVPVLPDGEAQHVFYAAVGAVLAGAVFGDHCSPISDTTVLSALASECTLEEHAWTQMPYALVVAGVSLLVGDGLVRFTNLESWAGWLIGTALLALILLVFGRRPTDDGVTSPARPPARVL